MNCKPICLFTYNRLEETKLTVKHLQKNDLAIESKLYIFSDGAKNESSVNSVEAVRQYLKTVDGFAQVKVIEAPTNKGLAKSIITGVSQVINEYGSVIVLEDDLITATNFLSYMNQALDFYQAQEKVWSVSGFSFPIKYDPDYRFDNSFGVRASSWGWATWKNRWELVDWDVSDYADFINNNVAKRAFNRGGSDMCKMLDNQITGKINSWAIRFCYAQFKQGQFDVYPVKSKVQNIGFSKNASNTQGMDTRFTTELDDTRKNTFTFSEHVLVNNKVLKQFVKPYSLFMRAKYKLLKVFS
ncbi:glycosyltransferase [Pseudoalteromonas distincta]|uniref:Glycosyltransferase family 2 protein n=1 Tax=Pseudoalteromonas distincta TaxID=77608 RepID=A0A4P9IZR0_9GAMM|nr:glycosyltransferase [Pseudoalteromonas distincta]QCU73927.1 glycosyltransferase family 2 protein [Pseudoalteromonas distincta]